MTVSVRIEVTDPAKIEFTQHLACELPRATTNRRVSVVTRVLPAGSSMIAPGLALQIPEQQSV